jgi:uncharacterized protein YqeY
MKDKLKTDSVAALKNHDNVRVGVLRYLISLIDKKELQLPPGQMSEATEVQVLMKELKDKEESREMFLKGNRDDLVKELDYEIAVVKEYLPAEMTEAELEKTVDEAIAEVGNNFGMVMKTVMGKTAGRVGGDKISAMVKQKISA